MTITRKQFVKLYEKHRNLTNLANAVGRTRAWASAKAKEYKIQPLCTLCGCEVDKLSTRYCEDCKNIKAITCRKSKWRSTNGNRSFGKRDSVDSAVEFYEACGLSVLHNKCSSNGDFELIVSGNSGSVNVKVFGLTEFNHRYQTRLKPVDDVDYYHLTDAGEVVYLVPAYEVTKEISYIGKKSNLSKYKTVKWIDDVVSCLEDGFDAMASTP